MDGIETIKTLMEQIENAQKNNDNATVIESLESIALLAEQMKKNAKKSKTDAKVHELLDKIKESTLSRKVATLKTVFSKLNKENLKKLKEKLLPSEKKEEQIDAVGEAEKPIEDTTDKKVEIIDPGFLKGVYIKAKERIKSTDMYKISKDMFSLLKQELSIKRNTISFKNAMKSLEIKGLEFLGKGLKKANEVKSDINLTNDVIKMVLREQIKPVKASIKRNFVTLPKEKISKLKEKISLLPKEISKKTKEIISKGKLLNSKISEKRATIKNAIVTISKEKFSKLKEDISLLPTAIGVTAIDIKEAIFDKALLLKSKIEPKIRSAKNIAVRKTGMQIALLKASIKERIDQKRQEMQSKYASSVEIQQQREQRIRELIANNSDFAREFFGIGNDEAQLSVAKAR